MPPVFGNLRFLADPDAVVDDAAEVLDEMPVEIRRDRSDRLVEEDVDARIGGPCRSWCKGDDRAAQCSLKEGTTIQRHDVSRLP